MKNMETADKNIPRHIAIILDGNGRWAKKRFMPRNYGHTQGSKVVEKICEDAYNMGVEYLTVYAFSTENWKRPKEEIDALMKLLRTYLETSLKRSSKNNMRVRVIGDKTGLPQDLLNRIEELEKASAGNTGLKFQVAINYGSRDEILRAIKKLYTDVQSGSQSMDQFNEKILEQYLDTKEIPDPDLIIRTSGEQRLSNFLLWQAAYSELYFTDVLWPDFNKNELAKAIEYYSSRNRKFGGIKES